MKTRQVLAARLKDCMARRPDLDTQVKVARAADVTQSTVGRCLSASSAATVDLLDQLAKAFGIPPLELIAQAQERQMLELWRKLTDEDKYRAMAFMEVSSRSKVSEHAYPPFQWDQRRAISTDLGAAAHRESQRGPREVEVVKDAKAQHEPSRQRKRSK